MKSIKIFSTFAISIGLLGCAQIPLFRPSTVPSREDAAAVTISATAIPWATISTAVQPNFSMPTGDAALAQIAPITSQMEQQVLSAFGASAQLGLAQGAIQSNSVSNVAGSTTNSSTTTNNGNTTTTTASGSSAPPTVSTTTTTSQAGTGGGNTSVTTTTNSSSQQIAAALPQTNSAIPAGATALAPTPLSGAPGIDPILKYQAALALYQEVQLMNNEVQDIAARRCFVPYMVQIKFAVLPYRQHLPYDLHARVSFFPDSVLSQASAAPTKSLREIAPQYYTDTNSCTALTSTNVLPKVVPILVTDDVERAVKSSSVEVAKQLSLAISAISPAVAAGGGLNALQQDLNAVSGQEINSRLTVTRQSDNTIYARIGAAEDPTSGLSLIGQTYDVSVLLLVPTGLFQSQAGALAASETANVRVVTYLEFRDSMNGTELPERMGSYSNESVGTIRDTFNSVSPYLGTFWDSLSPTKQYNFIDAITPALQVSDYESFRQALLALKNEGPEHGDTTLPSNSVSSANVYAAHFGEIWTRLTTLLTDSEYENATIELHGPDPISIAAQSATLFDDGKQSSQATLYQASGIVPGQINAKLVLTSPQPATLVAQSIVFDPKEGNLSFAFPSLKAWGLAGGSVTGSIVVLNNPCDSAAAVCPAGPSNTIFPVNFLEAGGAGQLGFTFTTVAKAIVGSHGTGTVTVTVANWKDASATITSDTPITKVTDGAGKNISVKDQQSFELDGNGDYTVTLQNLVPGSSVTLTAEGFDKQKKSQGKTSLTLPIPQTN